MDVKIIGEYGYEQALLGLSLSHNSEVSRMKSVARRLSQLDGGHNKFLESVSVWLDISGPRYWWQQMDTYRVGITKQSESTMHTILKKSLTQGCFERPVPEQLLAYLEKLRKEGRMEELKNILPEGFIQRRIVATNYKTLRNMVLQRKNHKLKEWGVFCGEIEKLEHWKELFGR